LPTRGVKQGTIDPWFRTTEANDIIRPIHSKAMPVLLTTEDEFDLWLGVRLEDRQ